MDSIKNSDTVQSIANGPVADKARAEADTTKNQFTNLAASRQTPQYQTATGQNLTHYHSFFYSLLSWENPRATGVSYATIVALLFIARYVPVAKFGLKVLYTVLGVTAAAEIAGKLALGEGISSKMRPRKYYTVPRETLESVTGDIEELINFFVVEFQRIVFAENIYATVAAFFTAFVSYFLIKITPSWGLALLFTTVLYFAPLAYITNKEFIDEHLNNAQNIISEQATQVRDLAAQHTGKAYEATSSALKDYAAQAQEAIGQTKKAAVDKGVISKETADKVTPEKAPVTTDDFPSAPKVEPAVPETAQAEEYKAEPIAA
ncbi:related to cell wall cwl1 [Lecanosticta acicola]|uniref:Reticulon-like protein n=1 Tax=Lecanosticta acicola TaxID=111012 RepID=A0AAI8W0S1_9PEZI|nr:related to cell wall cwl1 [Lecanosticta acicola]